MCCDTRTPIPARGLSTHDRDARRTPRFRGWSAAGSKDTRARGWAQSFCLARATENEIRFRFTLGYPTGPAACEFHSPILPGTFDLGHSSVLPPPCSPRPAPCYCYPCWFYDYMHLCAYLNRSRVYPFAFHSIFLWRCRANAMHFLYPVYALVLPLNASCDLRPKLPRRQLCISPGKVNELADPATCPYVDSRILLSVK